MMASKGLSRSGNTFAWSGTGDNLELFINSIGLGGQWSSINHGKQFRNDHGVSFNWYQKAGKIVIQGSAQQYLRAMFEKSLRAPVGLHCSGGQNAHLASNKENNKTAISRKRKVADVVERYSVPETFQPLAHLPDGICRTSELHRYLAHQLSTWSEITIAAPELTTRALCMIRALGRSHVNLVYTSERAMQTIRAELSPDERASMSAWIEEKVVVIEADSVRFLAGSNGFESVQVVLTSCPLDDRLFEDDSLAAAGQSVVTLPMSCYTFNVKWLSALVRKECVDQ